MSSSSYPNSHFLISLSRVCEESRRSGSRLTLITAEQARFGFPALNRISYVQSFFTSLLLCGFFLTGFCSCLIVSAFEVFCSSHCTLVHTGKRNGIQTELFSPSEDALATVSSKMPKYFLDINLFCDIPWECFPESYFTWDSTSWNYSVLFMAILHSTAESVELRVKLTCKKHALPSLQIHSKIIIFFLWILNSPFNSFSPSIPIFLLNSIQKLCDWIDKAIISCYIYTHTRIYIYILVLYVPKVIFNMSSNKSP